MAQDSDQITVALTGRIYVATFSDSLVLPETLATPDAAFEDLGYTTEDGVSFSGSQTIEDIMAWQKQTPVRRVVTGRGASVGFTLLQTNLDTFALGFGGGTWTEPTAGVFRYDPPADTDALAEYAVVVDFEDGTRNSRVVLKRATITDDVETSLVRNGAATIPVTLNALTPDGEDRAWYFLSDDPAYDPVP